MAVCKARIAAKYEQQTERYRATDERVRTYHEADNRVTDHASGVTTSFTALQKQGIGPMIEARLKAKGANENGRR